MRDAFGGVFMMRLMLAFITIFVAFTAVSLNYAKAFKIKNKVIDFVEQQQITDISRFKDNEGYKKKIDAIVEQANYVISCTNSDDTTIVKEIEDKNTHAIIGICYRGIIIKKSTEHNDSSSIYYDIITFSGWNMSSLNLIVSLSGGDESDEGNFAGRWQISGEAKVVKK